MLPITKTVWGIRKRVQFVPIFAGALTLATLVCGVNSLASTCSAQSASIKTAKSAIVRDIDGKVVALNDARYKSTVLFFVAHECPISNAYTAEMNRLAAQFGARKMKFVAVYPELGLNAATARQHAKEFGLRFPIVLDNQRRLVRRTQVHVTPEVAVLAPNGKVFYRGRIDNRFEVLGKPRLKATRHDLRAALDAINAGKVVATPRTVATGCYIEG